MSFEKPYYFVAMVFSPLWEGPKWLEVALDANFASVRLDADQSKRFGLAQMQLSVANDQQKTWYLAWRDEQGKWAIGIHDTVLQKQLQRTPPAALASQLGSIGISQEPKKKGRMPKFNISLPSSKSVSKVLFVVFVITVLMLSFRDRLIKWAIQTFITLEMNQETKIGEDMYKLMYKDLHVVNDPFLQGVLEESSRRLIRGAVYSYAWVIITDDRSYEIDALPGGIMLVPTGLLKRLDSLDELYGVMASKIMLTEQHAVLQEIVASAGWQAFWGLYKRRYVEAEKHLILRARGLVYGIRSIQIADRPAFIRLWMLNVDPKKWMGFLERQSAWQKKDPILKQTVYPITLERINYLKEIDARKPPTTTYVPLTFNWAEVKEHLPSVSSTAKK